MPDERQADWSLDALVSAVEPRLREAVSATLGEGHALGAVGARQPGYTAPPNPHRSHVVKTGLVILDMLNDFVDGTLANPAARPIIGNIDRLADAARKRDDWVVVYANDAHQPGDVEFEVFGEHALAGSLGAEVVPDLTPQDGDIVVPKRFYSAFTETDLDATCRVHNIGKMVVVGQHTNCCCRHTTYDAFLRGIAVAVVSDATCVFAPMVGDKYDEAQSDALAYLATFYNSELLATSELI